MRIKINRTVPGLVDFRPMVRGHEYETHAATAMSLIQDGYAEPVASTPAETRETRGPGRPRKEG